MKKSLKIKERTWKATSFHISSPPYLLSNSVKWGVSGSTPDLWKFSENGDHVDAWQMKKNLPSPQGLFWQEKVYTHNSRDGAGGLGRWGKPIFPTWFFLFFYFLLSKFENGITRERFGIRRRHARKLLFSSLNSQSSRMRTMRYASHRPLDDSDHAECIVVQ